MAAEAPVPPPPPPAAAAGDDALSDSAERLAGDSDPLALQELLAFCSDDDGDAADTVAPLFTTMQARSQSPDRNSSDSSSMASTPPAHLNGYESSSPPFDTGAMMMPHALVMETSRWAVVETRTAVHTPPPVPLEVGDADDIFRDKSPLYGTDDASPRSSVSSSVSTQVLEQERLREIRLCKRSRQRQRQRDELKYLGHHVQELKGQLERLQKRQREFSEQTLVATRKLGLQAANGERLVWSQLATMEREQLRTAIMENTRLRAQYECQLQIANGLKRLYQNQDSFSILDSSPDSGFITKKPRTDTISDDSTIFAALSRDFDAQYAQTDAILESTELTNFDGEREDEMLLKKNEHGVFFFDNLYSKVFPFEFDTVSQVLWQCLTVEQLQGFHGSYNVLQCTEDSAHTKVINTVTLPDAETTLVIHIATKKYFEKNRRVCIWEGIIEAQGAVSMRLRETGWNIVRPAQKLRPGQRGPVAIEQACVRITPEVQASSSNTEANLAVGTLTNLLIASYHRRMEQVHNVADDLLAMEFENVSLGD